MQEVAGHGVERTEGLVHEQHVGVLGEGPGQGHPLAHAARQLVGTLGAEVRRGARCAAARRPGSRALGPVHAAEPQRQLDVAGAPSATGTAPPPGTSARCGRRRRRWPAVGGSRPATRLSSVLLPQPEAPTRQTNSPRRTVEVDAVEGGRCAGRRRRRPWTPSRARPRAPDAGDVPAARAERCRRRSPPVGQVDVGHVADSTSSSVSLGQHLVEERQVVDAVELDRLEQARPPRRRSADSTSDEAIGSPGEREVLPGAGDGHLGGERLGR